MPQIQWPYFYAIWPPWVRRWERIRWLLPLPLRWKVYSRLDNFSSPHSIDDSLGTWCIVNDGFRNHVKPQQSMLIKSRLKSLTYAKHLLSFHQTFLNPSLYTYLLWIWTLVLRFMVKKKKNYWNQNSKDNLKNLLLKK